MASPAWAPQEAGLVQLCNLFSVLQKGENQAQILQQLEQYKQYPDFNNYLAYIFATAEQVPLEVRQGTGLYLKNSLRQNYDQTAQQLKDYLKGALVPMLAHPQKALRHTAGSCITAMVVSTGLSDWPQLVGVMQQALQASDISAVDGGLDALYKIVEESPVQMEATMANPAGSGLPSGPDGEGTTSASMLLVPPLLKLLQVAPGQAATAAAVKKQAAAVLNLMAINMPAGISHNFDTYLHSLFALAHDPSPGVRQEVVKGMVQLLNVQPDRIQPFLYQVVEYMLQSNEADDEGIALESCEFWLAFCEAQLDQELLRPFLPRLIPMLMKNMVFDEADEEVLEAQEAEAAAAANAPDRASDVRPLHHKQAGKHAGGSEEDDDDDEALSRWNLRKCSAAGLDRLSVVFGDQLLPVLMPIVQQRLQESDWRARESAILALGAVAEGCHMGLLPFLGSMVEMLLPKLADAQPMVRIISCWALGRYSYWLLSGAQESAALAKQAAQGQASPSPSAGGASSGGATPSSPGLHVQLGQVVAGVLRCVLDHNKVVQDAACGALANLCETAGHEEAGHVLAPYLQDMVQVLSTAIKQYSRRNLHLACDALCMLCEAMGPPMRDPHIAGTFMPALCERLSGLGPHDKELVPVMEALTMAANVLGRVLDPWAPTVWNAAMAVVVAQTNLRAGGQAAPSGPSSSKSRAAEYDADLHALALDMLSGLAEALGPSVEPLAASSPVVQLIMSACQDANPDVRQSGFALVGDMARSCISQLLPVVPQLVSAAVAALSPGQLSKETQRACNNACWSIGELAIKLQPAQVSGWAAGVAERMADMLAAGAAHQVPRSLLENAAITLGRVACQAPDQLAPHLAHFCAPWWHALRNVRDDVEKEQAFFGVVALLSRNPQPVLVPGPAFTSLVLALVSWRHIKNPTLQQEIKQVVQGLQSRMQAAGSWQAAVQQLEPAAAQKLAALGA